MVVQTLQQNKDSTANNLYNNIKKVSGHLDKFINLMYFVNSSQRFDIGDVFFKG